MSFLLSFTQYIAVTQDYRTDAQIVYVIIGNAALMKCEIPSFVADFVTVNSWIDNTGSEYFAEVDLNYGKIVVIDYLISMH